jgi:hypothetical protein
MDFRLSNMPLDKIVAAVFSGAWPYSAPKDQARNDKTQSPVAE